MYISVVYLKNLPNLRGWTPIQMERPCMNAWDFTHANMPREGVFLLLWKCWTYPDIVFVKWENWKYVWFKPTLYTAKKGISYEAMFLIHKTIIMLMPPYWSSLVHAFLVRDHSSITSSCFFFFFFHPPTSLMIYNTVNLLKFPFSHPTHPPL